MSRYFFHTADGSRERDTEGLELPDQNAAKKEGIRYAGAVLNDQPNVLWDGRDFRIEVTDSADRLLFTVVTLAIDAPASEHHST